MGMVYGIIQRWGNSQGIRIPKPVLLAAALHENDEVEIFTEKDCITLRKRQKPRNLDELFANYTGDFKPTEFDTGEAVGREVFD